jgi:ornithine carbamoyltransferase
MVKHFIDIKSHSKKDLQTILDLALKLKKSGKPSKQFSGKELAMIFQKNSTRTRVSFEVGARQLGGNAVVLSGDDMQLGRGESIEHTAKILSRYVDMIMLRTHDHEDILAFAKNSTVPIINGLTVFNHPCQIMADIMTFMEHRGSIAGKKVAWIGDGNNVCHSWIAAATKLGFSLDIATPKDYTPDADLLKWAQDNKAKITLSHDANIASEGADLVTTDSWASMGDKDIKKRLKAFKNFQVNDEVMSKAKKNALFMHCLPAHIGEEVTQSVIDSKQSVIFDEAENRLHAQKAIMCFLVG